MMEAWSPNYPGGDLLPDNGALTLQPRDLTEAVIQPRLGGSTQTPISRPCKSNPLYIPKKYNNNSSSRGRRKQTG